MQLFEVMGTAQECNKHKLGSNTLGEQILYIPSKTLLHYNQGLV
jgi:hypothetical protein